MTITIIGAGAIGGLAGAYMTQAGHDVLLVDRWKEHVDALNAKGLFIDGVRGEMTIPVKATTPDQLTDAMDTVLIATKSQHTLDAVRQILPLLTPDSARRLLPERLQRARHRASLNEAGLPGEARSSGSIPNYGGALVDPGYIEFVHEGPIQLGEMDGRRTPRLKELAEALSALTNVQISDNIWGQIWAKEVYSAQVVFSALATPRSTTRWASRRYARIAGAVVSEALEIAEANGITVEAFDFFDPANYKPGTPAETPRSSSPTSSMRSGC